jgi:translocation and assembly module TamA
LILGGRRLLLLLGLLGPAAGQAQVTLEAPAPISRLLSPYLGAYASPTPKMLADFSEALATEGYFSPTVEPAGDAGALRLKIDPGPRTLVSEVNVAIDGGLPAERRERIIADWSLPVGQPFRQEDWNAAKQQVLGQLLDEEYPAARLLNSLADIDAERQRAALSVHYDSGPRHVFGELRIDGLQLYDQQLVARYNRHVLPGEPYREADLNALQANLQATPYFSSVRLVPDRDATSENADGSISTPVVVYVRERQPHRIGFGAGLSSNTGARVETSYQTADLFGRAWSLESGLRLEQKKQTLFADVFLPPDAGDRRHSFGAMSERTDIEDLKTDRYAFGVQSVQQRGSIEQRLSLSWQQERREPTGAPEVTSRALVPNIMWTWRQVDNLLDPGDGIVLQFQVGGGAKAALSDQNFVRLHGRWQQFIRLGTNNQLTLRGELGRTFADSRLRIPQDFLFRTGGTGSVRGYGYQSLGIKEGQATVGGRYLAVASAEFTHWLNESWGIAAFVDAGDAVDSLTDVRLAAGYGLGARWRSPAGPIGIDLAYGERSREVHLHFSLAIPF